MPRPHAPLQVRGRITIQEGTNAPYRGMLHATACIVRGEGLFALWRGWVPSVIGVVPYMGLNFGVYETAKDMIIKFYGERYCWGLRFRLVPQSWEVWVSRTRLRDEPCPCVLVSVCMARTRGRLSHFATNLHSPHHLH